LKRLSHKKILVLLGSGWLIMQLIMLYSFGIVTKIEAVKYTAEAGYLLEHGHFSEPKYIFYSLTILVIAVSLKLTGGYKLAVLIQLLLNGLATAALYKTTVQLSQQNKTTAYIATALFISFFPIQQWNTYLYTESVFISVTIGLLYVIVKTRQRTLLSALKILLAAALCVLSRPFGLLFIPPVLIYLVWHASKRFRWVMFAVLIAGCTGMYAMLNYAFKGGGDMNAMKPFIEEHIICFNPTNLSQKDLVLLNSGNPVNDIFYYIVHNPARFLGLAARRLLSFFNFYRGAYSAIHNLYLIASMILVYGFALAGLQKFIRAANFYPGLYILSLLVIYPLATTLQCDDYHSRFTIVIFPYLIILAAFGIENLRKRKISL
jgi:Dolichyl-phosphate-mannose-protein mannosyltransferase